MPQTGLTGIPGVPGSPGPAATSKHLIVIHHLQHDISPDRACPEDSQLMRISYSVYGYQEISSSLFVTNDLASLDSCPPSGVSTFRLCSPELTSQENTCDKSSKDFRTFYLSAKDPPSDVIYRSRCSVCEVTSPVRVMHSYSEVVPVCNENESRLWSGHSFRGFNFSRPQDLSCLGSCLPHAMQSLVVKCLDEVCEQEKGVTSWVSSIEGDKPSRCSVCKKN